MRARAAIPRAAAPLPRACAPRPNPLSLRPTLRPETTSLPMLNHLSLPRSFAFSLHPARFFSTEAKPPANTTVPAATKRDPRASPDISPITGLPKPPGMWREVWLGGEETTWISPPIPVTKRLAMNPYQFKLKMEKKRLRARDRDTTKKPPKVLLTNHVVQLITTGKPLNDRRKLTFKIPIKMSKVTLRQYLSKLYSLDVAKVNTINVEGKWKRRMDAKGRFNIFKVRVSHR